MAFDALTETEAILTRLSVLEGGRVFDGMPDALVLQRNPDYSMKAYINVEFGELVVTYDSRTIQGEEMQPYIMPVTISIIGPTAKVCREVAKGVRELLLDWSPSENNATKMRLSGGGQFSQRDSAGVPSRFRRIIFAETTLNQSAEIPA